MKSKLTHLIIILVICCLCPIVLGSFTNSRYFSQVSSEATPQLASTYFEISKVTEIASSITPGESTSAQYQLTNKDASNNINSNNLQYYLNLVDQSGNETTDVTITSIGNGYTYQTGKGYGPIQLAYDGETTDTKTFNITFECGEGLTTSGTLNYKVQVYAESKTNASIYTTKSVNINFNVRVYTITYNLDGGNNDSNNPSRFSTIPQTVTLNDPTKEGYLFKGWYDNSSFTGNEITSVTNQRQDIILYAKWTPVIYFQVPPDWYGDTIYAYVYNDDNGAKNAAWPGLEMTKIDSTKNIYSYEFSENETISDYANVIFANNIRSNNDVTIQSRQTADLDFNESNLGNIFVPELYSPTDTNKTRVFAYGKNLNVYLWNSSTGVKNAGWPGEALTDKISGNAYQKIIDRTEYNMMIFNANNQTDDLSVPTHQDLTVKITGVKTQNVYRLFYKGSWHNYNNWKNSEYSNWLGNDYIKFQQAQTAYGY